MTTTATQESLPFEADPPEATDVAWLEGELLRANRWLFAGDLCEMSGMENTEDNRCQIRHTAAESEKIISGQQGYRHVAHATAEEVRHFYSKQVSQCKKMMARGIRVLRYYHSLIG